MTASLGEIELVPLADESLGVRSMAIGLRTPDLAILLDAGVSLAPRRHSLPPHPYEFLAAKEARERIERFAERCELVTVSHYHLDHYTPSFTSFYEWSSEEAFEKVYSGKLILAKKPDSSVSFNQRRRASVLLRELRELGCKVVEADGLSLTLGETVVRALGPYSHGFDTALGRVLAYLIKRGNARVVYAPDVQGPVENTALSELLSLSPTLLIVGGPPTYLEGVKVSAKNVERGLENLATISNRLAVVVSHHTLRDLAWRSKLKSKGAGRLLTYAELLGVEERLLEARRRELYEKYPPPDEFLNWLKSMRRGEKSPPPLPSGGLPSVTKLGC